MSSAAVVLGALRVNILFESTEKRYHIYPNFGNYNFLRTSPKICTASFYCYLLICLKKMDLWQTVRTLIRHHVLHHLVWNYIVCTGLSLKTKVNTVTVILEQNSDMDDFSKNIK